MALPKCSGAGGTGTKYTYAQLEALWINAGGSVALAPIAAAIALAESQGCSAALNVDDNGGTQSSWGLWQISDGTHNKPTANILDPTVNASAAVDKWRRAGGSFSPWGTFTSGAYRKYVATSTSPDFAAVPVSVAASVTPVGNDTGDPCVMGIPAFHTAVGDFPGWCILSKSQARAVIAGSIMMSGIIIGLFGLAVVVAGAWKETAAGRSASRVTSFAQQAGRAVRDDATAQPTRRKSGTKPARKRAPAARSSGSGTP